MSKHFTAKGLKGQVVALLVAIAKNKDKIDAAQLRASLAATDRLAAIAEMYDAKLASPIGPAETNRIPAVTTPESGSENPFIPKMSFDEAFIKATGGDHAAANQGSQ